MLVWHTSLLAFGVVCEKRWTGLCSTYSQKIVILWSVELQQAKKYCVANCRCGLRHGYAAETEGASTDAMLWSAKRPWTDYRLNFHPLDELRNVKVLSAYMMGDETSACSCSFKHICRVQLGSPSPSHG